MRMPHGPLRLVAAMVAAGLLVVGPVVPASAAAGPNLSPGKATQASGSVAGYPVSAVNDGDQATYWESAGNSFPQWARVDLGTATSVDQIVLKVPAPAVWQTRTQTLSVQGSADGSTYSTVVASADYTFNPATGNKVTISFGAAAHRYWRINVTANTGWPAAQISEFEVYGAASGGDDQAPTAPSNLAYTQPAAGQIRLTWNASTDNVGVTGYDIYANGQLRAGVGTVLTYTDTQPASATVTYFVRARDAAGNQSSAGNSVTRTGTGDPGSNLAIGKEIVESGHVHNFVAANANDDNLATYWEADSGAFPNTLTVKLGANAVVSAVVVKLNPDSSWGTRTQNIQVLGREQSATAYENLVSAANYTFNPASGGNSVRIDLFRDRRRRPAQVRRQQRRARRAGGGIPGHRRARAQPRPHDHEPHRGARPRRTSPARSRCRPRSGTRAPRPPRRTASTSTSAAHWPAPRRFPPCPSTAPPR